MGERRFLLVDSSALPDVFLKVLQAKELLASGSVSNISTTARQAGISRSAFYKYKDYVFDAETGREAITVIATLLDKPARRVSELTVDYSCFVIPDAFVVGYGLDYDEVYRNLPEVGILSPSVYENK